MKIPARIIEIVNETPLVKTLRLRLDPSGFNFYPGQWIDCYVDQEGKLGVAGYTIASSPSLLGEIQIAVKKGDNPVTQFIHKEALVGDTLFVEGGQGDFYYSRDMGDSVLLIGGGIGITPLVSILRYIDDSHPDVKVTLIYSAKTPSEIIFQDELENISRNNQNIRCIITVTQPENELWNGHVGRIEKTFFINTNLDLNAIIFLCCPPSMAESMKEILHEMGASKDRIRYEQWW